MKTPRVLPGWCLLLALVCAGPVGGQEARTNPPAARVYRTAVNPHWFADNQKFWYRVEVAAERFEFVLVEAKEGRRRPAFDHGKLASAYSEKSGKTVTGDQLPFTAVKFAADGKSVFFKGSADITWRCDLDSYQITEAKEESVEAASEPASATPAGRRGGRGGVRGAGRRPATEMPDGKSPNGKWEAYVHGHNLFVRHLDSKKESALTHDANPDNSYAHSFASDRGVGMDYTKPDPESSYPDIQWSPDSRHLLALKHRAGTDRRVYYVESSPADQAQPKLHSYPYLKPGDEVPVQKPHLFDVTAQREIPISEALFPNPWSIGDFRWNADSSRFTFLYNQRGHQVLRVIAVDAQSGAATPVVDEQSRTFIDYSGKFYADYLDGAGEIIWMSERDGWNHLYLYDAKAGQVKNQITRGEWVVHGVDRVDPEKRQIWFRAGGVIPGQDPYYVHYCRVNFDGNGLTVLTAGNGTHGVTWSPNRQYLLDSYSRVDQPPITELRRAEDGKLACLLETGDASELLATGWRPSEPFVAKGRDGVTDIYGVITRPKGFDPAKRYPVIENIYAGPHDAFAPKAFNRANRDQNLADLGFVVVQCDGMGTSKRSKKFHDICWKNIVDAGFPDRIAWIKAAAAKDPALDVTRVGIFGTSAGGQNALGGLLTHGEFYKAGVADCGCHDNRMDKIWWNEQWMGWPVGPEYEANSNVTLAHQLTGKLFLMVGEDDENVDPATTMQVVNALIKADKDFELLVMPGRGHGVAGTPYGQRRLRDFFTRTLLNGNLPASAASKQ